MAAGIVAFFTALPAIITLISRLGYAFDSLLQLAKQNNLNAWIDSLEGHIDQLKKAQTQDEKLAAAQNLVGCIRGLGN